MGARIRHLNTILRHKWYVFQECRACGITWQGIKHDWSKFSPSEFSESAKHFQGNRSPIEAVKEEDGYSVAWLHHKGHNKHHWEWWTDFGENGEVIANAIPFKYILEMICDWIGAGKAYTNEWFQGDPLTYYLMHREGRHFHPDTEETILYFLEIIDEYGLKKFHEEARKALRSERKRK